MERAPSWTTFARLGILTSFPSRITRAAHMTFGTFRVPQPVNEPVKSYAPGSAEKIALKKALARMSAEEIEIPIVVGGKEVRTGSVENVTMPHAHARRIATFHQAGANDVAAAIESAEKARPAWAAMPWEERAAIFLRAAEMLATTHRDVVNAAT